MNKVRIKLQNSFLLGFWQYFIQKFNFPAVKQKCRTFSIPVLDTFQPLKINVGQIPFGHFPALYVRQIQCPQYMH